MRIIKTLFLLIFTLAVFSVLIVIYVSKFNSKGYLGSLVKEQFIKYPKLVDLAGMNEPGDYRYLYTSDSYQELKVVIGEVGDIKVSEDSDTWVKEMIEETLGINANISFTDLDPVGTGAYSDEGLDQLRKQVSGKLNGPVLYIIYTTEYEEAPGYIGLTLHKDTVFLFNNALQNLNTNPELTDRLVRSTLMHEWAHLLGVGHTEGTSCIMSEKIHVSDNPGSWKGNIPIEYCTSTLHQIQTLKEE